MLHLGALTSFGDRSVINLCLLSPLVQMWILLNSLWVYGRRQMCVKRNSKAQTKLTRGALGHSAPL